MPNRLLALGLALFALVLTGCASSYTVGLRNDTGADLTFCPVLSDPPPPHRVVSTRSIPDGVREQIKGDGFNPVYWDPLSNMGIQVQFDLDGDPAFILVRVMQYVVPPGSEGNDPAQQPTLVQEFLLDVVTSQKNIGISAGPIGASIPITFSQS